MLLRKVLRRPSEEPWLEVLERRRDMAFVTSQGPAEGCRVTHTRFEGSGKRLQVNLTRPLIVLLFNSRSRFNEVENNDTKQRETSGCAHRLRCRPWRPRGPPPASPLLWQTPKTFAFARPMRPSCLPDRSDALGAVGLMVSASLGGLWFRSPHSVLVCVTGRRELGEAKWWCRPLMT